MPTEQNLLKQWFVYLIRDKDNRLYTGITTDVERRFKHHTAGKGAKNLKGRAPLTLHCAFPVSTQQEALRAERTIKKWPKAKKEILNLHPEWISEITQS